MIFGEELIYIQKQRNLSQEQLEEKVGIDKRIISRYETDKVCAVVLSILRSSLPIKKQSHTD